MFSLAVDKRAFARQHGRLTNHREIAEYSLTVDREVLNDRTHARYLVPANIRKEADYDLKQGIDTFISKVDLLEKEGRLDALCAWACAQEGDDLGQLFDGARFVGLRHTLRAMAQTLMTHNPRNPRPEVWLVVAVKTGDVVLLCEQSKSYEPGSDALASYGGYKFEQFMTADAPGGEPDTEAAVDLRTGFKRMVRSDLVLDGESVGICCAAEIDALDGDTSIDLKTRAKSKDFTFMPSLSMVLRAELSNVRTAVIGWKNERSVVERVTKTRIDKFAGILEGAEGKCLAFLATLLQYADRVLKRADACQMIYHPHTGTIEIESCPREDALDLLTPEFKQKFKIN